MKRKVENWSVERLNKERARISFPEYQREKSLWSNDKKSKLIDSILNDFDIPKLYFNSLKDDNIEVIDGQQRLWSVWEFLNDEYQYKAGGKRTRFSKMTPANKEKILKYKFQATVFEEANDDYLRELFVRLQIALLLNSGEKLHARKGKMKQLVFEKLASHTFIKQIGISEKRYAKQTLCAQISINSFNRKKLGSFIRTRHEDLEHFFIEYIDPKGRDLELFTIQSKRISDVLDQLSKCLGGNAKILRNRSYILSIYLFIEELVNGEGKLSTKEQKSFSNFVSQLGKRLKDEARLGMDRTNREIYEFQTLLSSAPGEAYQIERRHKKLSEYYEHFKKTGKIKGDR